MLQSCGASSTLARLRRTWRNFVSRKPKVEVTSWGFDSVVLFCVEIKVPAIILSNLRRPIKLAINWHWGTHANYVRLLLMIAMHRLDLFNLCLHMENIREETATRDSIWLSVIRRLTKQDCYLTKRTWGDREGNWGRWPGYVDPTEVIFSFRKSVFRDVRSEYNLDLKFSVQW